jgi:hypothetical protein
VQEMFSRDALAERDQARWRIFKSAFVVFPVFEPEGLVLAAQAVRPGKPGHESFGPVGAVLLNPKMPGFPGQIQHPTL